MSHNHSISHIVDSNFSIVIHSRTIVCGIIYFKSKLKFMFMSTYFSSETSREFIFLNAKIQIQKEFHRVPLITMNIETLFSKMKNKKKKKKKRIR